MISIRNDLICACGVLWLGVHVLTWIPHGAIFHCVRYRSFFFEKEIFQTVHFKPINHATFCVSFFFLLWIRSYTIRSESNINNLAAWLTSANWFAYAQAQRISTVCFFSLVVHYAIEFKTATKWVSCHLLVFLYLKLCTRTKLIWNFNTYISPSSWCNYFMGTVYRVYMKWL